MGEDLVSDLQLLKEVVLVAEEIANEMEIQFVNESGDVPEEFMMIRSMIVRARMGIDKMIREEE